MFSEFPGIWISEGQFHKSTFSDQSENLKVLESARVGGHRSVSTLTGHTSVMEAKILDFPDFSDFRKLPILGIFRRNLGSGMVCNRLEMAVGFKWTDSQPISTNMSPFSTILMISVILLSFSMV